jgi:hypothetical protein
MPSPRMVLLSAPFDPGRSRPVEPLPVAGGLATGAVLVALAVGLAMELADDGLREVGQGVVRGAMHGAFLVGGWIVAGGRRACLPPVLLAATVVLTASIASTFTPWSASIFLLVPVLLVSGGARHEELRAIGLRAKASFRSLGVGLATGTFLGAHMIVSASLTAGYAVRVSSPGPYLAGVAYDIGANALTAEWLFRGALFSRLWRRWELWPAAGLSTLVAVLRYLVDPALPATVEVRAGAIFYTALLGLAACALRARSGSLLPGYLAAVTFFAAYRMLTP